MEKFLIKGGRKLEGRVRVSGAKNAVLPIMAASLLTEDEVVLRNVPDLRDVRTMAAVLTELGVEVAFNDGVLRLRTSDESAHVAPYELVSTMRASICVLGPLLAKRGRACVSMPGGCVLGVRPIDLHMKGLNALGARLQVKSGYLTAENVELRGAEVFLGSAFGSTVLGTANLMMAAVLTEGRTVIENAAMEPEVQDLACFLQKMGARISGGGTHRIEIEGVSELHGCDYTVIPDRIEAGTFLIAGGLVGGCVQVEGANPDHLASLLDVLNTAGVSIHKEVGQNEAVLLVEGRSRFEPVDVSTHSYPGFPTDLQAQMMMLLTLSDGISIVTERIYPDRFIHVAELNRLGARIRKEGNQAIIQGVPKLSGAPVMASDLRASAALILAGLVAEGETEINRIYHIDRGYDRIDRKLQDLGAQIHRI